jgi:hypothetical protein
MKSVLTTAEQRVTFTQGEKGAVRPQRQNWSDAATSQRMLAATCNWKKWEVLGREQSCQLLIF